MAGTNANQLTTGMPNPRSGLQPNGLTKKQDDFCHRVAEGHNFSAAYRMAYQAGGMSDPTVWREAHRLSRRQNIALRIAELVDQRQDEERVQAAVRAHKVTAFLDHLMENGKSETSRLRAAELLGKTVGLFVDQQEAPKMEPTIEELEDEIRMRLGMLKTVSSDQGDP